MHACVAAVFVCTGVWQLWSAEIKWGRKVILVILGQLTFSLPLCVW